MYKDKKILAVIPARSGSQGLPKKNVRPFLGKPLIAWTIKQALSSKYLDKIVVSTNSATIAKISRKYGAEVPFMRPKILATSSAKMIDVLNHAINYIQDNDNNFELIMLLQPTSPLRKTSDIDKSIELLFKKKAGAIISVCQAEHHPFLTSTLLRGGGMDRFLKLTGLNKNRQDLPDFYRINGALYLTWVNYLCKNKSFFGKKTYAYIMPAEKSIDIDHRLDFDFAEFLMKKVFRKNVKKH